MSKDIEYPIEASKINQDTKFQEMKDFVHILCPLPNHWCNGQPIKNLATMHNHAPCQYYIPGKGCMHPENPKNRKKRVVNIERIIENGKNVEPYEIIEHEQISLDELPF